MGVKCKKCGREYADDIFARDRVVMCDCGAWVEPESRIAARQGEKVARDREAVEDLARRADRITFLMLHTDTPEVDLAIEIAALRDHVRESFPDREQLFRMVYESRWKRFREQGWARREEG